MIRMKKIKVRIRKIEDRNWKEYWIEKYVPFNGWVFQAQVNEYRLAQKIRKLIAEEGK